MIREHAFNTAWWGKPVGFVEDAKVLELPQDAQSRAFAPYAWVELRAPLSAAPLPASLRRAGFVLADTQVRFRIRLQEPGELSTSLASLHVVSATERPFTLNAEDLEPFAHERFALLPGVTSPQLTERYARWARRLIEDAPGCALRLTNAAGETQGWFLAQPREAGLELTLAMRHARATVSGMLLYQRALGAFAKLGARLGFASFSVSNTAVHNIYARLGAVFLEPEGCWLRWETT